MRANRKGEVNCWTAPKSSAPEPLTCALNYSVRTSAGPFCAPICSVRRPPDAVGRRRQGSDLRIERLAAAAEPSTELFRAQLNSSVPSNINFSARGVSGVPCHYYDDMPSCCWPCHEEHQSP